MDAREFVDKLMKEDGVTEFCGVSDSTLKYVIEELESRDSRSTVTYDSYIK